MELIDRKAVPHPNLPLSTPQTWFMSVHEMVVLKKGCLRRRPESCIVIAPIVSLSLPALFPMGHSPRNSVDERICTAKLTCQKAVIVTPRAGNNS